MAFVRACGADDDEVDRWVAARRRVVVGLEPEPIEVRDGTASIPEGPDETEPKRSARLKALVAVAVLAVSGTAMAVWWSTDDRNAIPPEGARVLSAPDGKTRVGTLRVEHKYSVYCRLGGSQPWMLTFVHTTEVVGWVDARDLPTADVPDCARAGESAPARTGYLWQQGKPGTTSEHVGDVKLGVGHDENLRWYVFREGEPYPASRETGWYAVVDVGAPEPSVGFVNCSQLVLPCAR
ncbi:hypothetical protein GCM10022243_56720 [Saccharothrix violaceirubra]|uniref:Uncharacterized protein n=1 Tax=Saccharothrix violaceirubra TaxID=413306 RepID=A0A7W7WWA5_9PSEU|nr:hypothetical protein [Saccharothrix violaceirubra]MBB4965896.1 hypothetical protein [Saccharothrix violaceirubra]